jgi:muconolactone delta-isomerase
MPQYQVTMTLEKADPLISMGQLTQIVTEAILPSLEALKDLQAKGKVLAGGHPVGQQYILMYMEAESEDEVHELLKDLPLSELGSTDITEMKSFDELGSRSESASRKAYYRKRVEGP